MCVTESLDIYFPVVFLGKLEVNLQILREIIVVVFFYFLYVCFLRFRWSEYGVFCFKLERLTCRGVRGSLEGLSVDLLMKA